MRDSTYDEQDALICGVRKRRMETPAEKKPPSRGIQVKLLDHTSDALFYRIVYGLLLITGLKLVSEGFGL